MMTALFRAAFFISFPGTAENAEMNCYEAISLATFYEIINFGPVFY
ncbi:MAG: hypothetical protein NTY64_08245 [Deltaproteobacteria bacterium]|nr:hypothetical protein [Deltaproteobacteria bacterium]